MKTELESLFYWLTQGNEKNLQLKRFIVNQRLYIRQSSIFFFEKFQFVKLHHSCFSHLLFQAKNLSETF